MVSRGHPSSVEETHFRKRNSRLSTKRNLLKAKLCTVTSNLYPLLPSVTERLYHKFWRWWWRHDNEYC